MRLASAVFTLLVLAFYNKGLFSMQASMLQPTVQTLDLHHDDPTSTYAITKLVIGGTVVVGGIITLIIVEMKRRRHARFMRDMADYLRAIERLQRDQATFDVREIAAIEEKFLKLMETNVPLIRDFERSLRDGVPGIQVPDLGEKGELFAHLLQDFHTNRTELAGLAERFLAGQMSSHVTLRIHQLYDVCVECLSQANIVVGQHLAWLDTLPQASSALLAGGGTVDLLLPEEKFIAILRTSIEDYEASVVLLQRSEARIAELNGAWARIRQQKWALEERLGMHTHA